MPVELNAEESLAAFQEQKHRLILTIKNERNIKKRVKKVRERNMMDRILHTWTRTKPWQGCTRRLKELVGDSDEGHPQPLTITHFNPDYFTLVRGRPVGPPPTRRNVLQEILRTRLLTSLIDDTTHRNQYHFLTEAGFVCDAFHQYETSKQLLHEFISCSDTSVLNVVNTNKIVLQIYLNEVQRLSVQRNEKMDKYYEVMSMWKQISHRKSLKETLYQISPSSWQKQYNEEKKVWDPTASKTYKDFTEIIEEYPDLDKYDKEVSSMLKEMKKLNNTIGPNLIYFKSMVQTEEVFKDIEKEGLVGVQYLAKLMQHRDGLVKKIDEMDAYYADQRKNLDNAIGVMERRIEYNVNSVKFLKERLNIRNLADTIIGGDTLMVKSLILLMYDEIVGERNPNMTNREMMEALEEKMIKLWIDMRSMDPEKQRSMAREMKDREALALFEADKAKTLEAQMEQLLGQMEKFYKEKPYPATKPLRPRSPPPDYGRQKKMTQQDATTTQPSKTHYSINQGMESGHTIF